MREIALDERSARRAEALALLGIGRKRGSDRNEAETIVEDMKMNGNGDTAPH